MVEREKIKKIYDSFLSDIPYIDVRKLHNQQERLKDIEPNMFPPGYQRMCQSPPFIVDHVIPEDEKNNHAKMIEENKSIVGTLKNSSQYLMYPTNPLAHYYSCSQNNYIGLKKNILANKDEFEFLPCCYKEDQIQKKHSYLNTFINEISSEKRKSQGYIYTTMKILPIEENQERYGILPENIADALGLSIKELCARTGVESESSFFHAIISATDGMYTLIGKEKREELAKKLRNKVLAISKKTQDSTYDKIEDYIGYTERIIGMRIYCFVYRQYIYPKGSLRALLHELNENNNCILLLENYGLENNKIPQYEIILRSSTSGFKHEPFGSDVSKHIDNLEKLVNNMKIHDVDISSESYSNIIEKCEEIGVDDMGFVRLFNMKNMTILSEPIPVDHLQKKYLNKLMNAKDCKIMRNASEKLITSIKGEKIAYSQNYDDEVNSVILQIDRNLISIPTTTTIDGFKKLSHSFLNPLQFPLGEHSLVKNYLNCMKKASIVVEYFKYFFSIYVASKNIDKYDAMTVMDEFIKNKIIFDEKIDYNSTSLNFNLEESFIHKKLKLIIRDEIILEKLKYKVKMTPIDELIGYKDRTFLTIEGGYFKSSHEYSYIITSLVDSYTEENQNIIYDDIIKDTMTSIRTRPYFFYYDNFVFVAQPCSTSMEEAIKISEVYLKTFDKELVYKGINISGQDEKNETVEKHLKYIELSYKRHGVYVVESHDTTKTWKSVPFIYSYRYGHRKDNIIHYGALLPYTSWQKRKENTDIKKIIDEIFDLTKMPQSSTTS